MVNCFRRLVAQRAGIIILQAAPFSLVRRPTSFVEHQPDERPFPPVRRPTSFVEHQPDEEFAFGQSAHFAKQLSPHDGVLTNEKRQVGRRSREGLIWCPSPANFVHLTSSTSLVWSQMRRWPDNSHFAVPQRLFLRFLVWVLTAAHRQGASYATQILRYGYGYGYAILRYVIFPKTPIQGYICYIYICRNI